MSENTSSKIDVINGLRGLSILGVLYHHSLAYYTPPGWRGIEAGGLSLSPIPFLANGWMSVNLFFLLSGFVLYLPYAQGARRLETRSDLAAFYKRRWLRLMPLFYFCLAVSWIFFYHPHPVQPRDWLDLLILGSTGFVFSERLFFPPCNWVLWSLGVEIWFSLVFPLLVVAVKRIGWWRLLTGVCLLALGVRFWGTWADPNPRLSPYLNYIKDSLAGRLDDFAVGMLLAFLFLRAGKAVTLGRRYSRVLVMAGFLICVAASVMWDNIVLGRISWIVKPFTNLVLDAGLGLLLWGALGLPPGLWRGLLECRPLQVVGMMCYSLYVWHMIVIYRVVAQPAYFDAVHMITSLVLLLIVAGLTYRYIEFGHVRDWRGLFLWPRPARSS